MHSYLALMATGGHVTLSVIKNWLTRYVYIKKMTGREILMIYKTSNFETIMEIFYSSLKISNFEKICMEKE